MQEIFQERVVSHRQDEFTRLRREREEQIAQILMSRRQEREKMRKMKFYLSLEEERQKKLREEEEAQKREGERLLFKSYNFLLFSSLLSLSLSLSVCVCFLPVLRLKKGIIPVTIR